MDPSVPVKEPNCSDKPKKIKSVYALMICVFFEKDKEKMF